MATMHLATYVPRYRAACNSRVAIMNLATYPQLPLPDKYYSNIALSVWWWCMGDPQNAPH